MKKKLAATLFLFNFIFVFAQNMSPTFFAGHQKIDTLCAQARVIMKKPGNSDAPLKLANEAKQIALEENSAIGLAKANATFGWIFLNNKNLPVAKSFVEKALKNIDGKNYPEAEGMLHHQVGIILDKMSEPKSALAHYFKSYQYYSDSKNYFRQAQVAGEISRLYLITKDRATSEKYGKIQEELLKKYPNAQLQISLENRQFFSLMDDKKYDEALALSKKSLQLALANKLTKDIPTFYFSIAGAYFEKGNIPEAIKNIDLAIDFAKKNNLPYADHLVGKSQILLQQGKKAEAEQLLLNSAKELGQSGDKFMEMQARDMLVNFYKSSGKTQQAAEQMLLANKIKDSLSNAKQAVAMKELEYQYKDEEKEKLLESYRTSATLKNWIIALSLLLGAFALYLFYSMKKSLLLKQEYFNNKQQLLEAEKRTALKEKELAKTEEEKARLNQKLMEEEQRRMKLEKENTERELASVTVYVQEKNKMLENLQEKMDALLNNSTGEKRNDLLEISRNIRQGIGFETDWNKMKLHFEKVHPDFFKNLTHAHPNLTQNELKHCAYIKMNMSNKETANLLGVDYNTVKMSRYRIKKKMNLSQEDDLSTFINKISDGTA